MRWRAWSAQAVGAGRTGAALLLRLLDGGPAGGGRGQWPWRRWSSRCLWGLASTTTAATAPTAPLPPPPEHHVGQVVQLQRPVQELAGLRAQQRLRARPAPDVAPAQHVDQAVDVGLGGEVDAGAHVAQRAVDVRGVCGAQPAWVHACGLGVGWDWGGGGVGRRCWCCSCSLHCTHPPVRPPPHPHRPAPWSHLWMVSGCSANSSSPSPTSSASSPAPSPSPSLEPCWETEARQAGRQRSMPLLR
jgi:hypothetical protein